MKPVVLRCIYCAVLCTGAISIDAQGFDATQSVAATVELDSVVILATHQGFNVEDFIRLVSNGYVAV